MEEGKLNIRVLIDGKMQRLEIDRRNEELVREAAKRLNSTIFEYKRDIKMDDATEYLRLAALQYAISAVEHEFKEKASVVTKHLKEIEATLEEHLSEIGKK